MTVKRVLPVICAREPGAVRDFYTTLLGFSVEDENQWLVRLRHPDQAAIELLVSNDGADVPQRFCQGEGGALYLSLEVDNVDDIWARARDFGAQILQAPGHDDYDRRNLLLRDPAGTVVEVFSFGDPEEAEKSEYMLDA